jgi:uncharacterized phage protein (TIGR02216 family)
VSWPARLRLAALRFGLPPESFWRLSLAEWRALAADPAALAPLDRRAFQALAAAHPDTPAHERDPEAP